MLLSVHEPHLARDITPPEELQHDPTATRRVARGGQGAAHDHVQRFVDVALLDQDLAVGQPARRHDAGERIAVRWLE